MITMCKRTTALGFGDMGDCIAAALALLLAIAAPAWADYGQICRDNWDDAPASSLCSGESVERVTASNAGDLGDCVIRRGSCAMTVTVGVESVSFSISDPYIQETPDATSSIDLCFSASDSSSATSGYIMTLKSPCDAEDTTSSTATSNGLSAR